MYRRTVRLAVLVIGLAAATATCAWRRQVAAESAAAREAEYNRAVQSYAARFEPGMARQAIETALRHDGTSFGQMCCMDEWKGAYDDLIHVGDEARPWYCSAHRVYVGLAFRATEPHETWDVQALATDTLIRVRLFHSYEGCL